MRQLTYSRHRRRPRACEVARNEGRIAVHCGRGRAQLIISNWKLALDIEVPTSLFLTVPAYLTDWPGRSKC